jgi:hypothetical protein
MARALELHGVESVDLADGSGWSALHAASQGTSTEAVRLLLLDTLTLTRLLLLDTLNPNPPAAAGYLTLTLTQAAGYPKP